MADEKDLQMICVQYATLRGVLVRRNNVGVGKDHTRYGMGNGSSDIVMVIPPTGRAAFCELKAPGRKPRAEQIRFLDDAQRAGAIAFWCDDFPLFQRTLDAIIRAESKRGTSA